MFKSTLVEEVKVGQFVKGVGIVQKIHRYHDEASVVGKTQNDTKFKMWEATQREANIVEQVELNFTEAVSRIVLVNGIKNHRYNIGDSVEVLKLEKMAA